MKFSIILSLIAVVTCIPVCKEKNVNKNNMEDNQEERVIGISGEISGIKKSVEDYKRENSGKVYKIHTIKVNLKTGNKLTAYEDTSQRTADIRELNSIYEAKKFTEIQFETSSPLAEKLENYNQFKTGDRIIIRIPYWSIAKFLNNETDAVRIYLIEKAN